MILLPFIKKISTKFCCDGIIIFKHGCMFPVARFVKLSEALNNIRNR